jgi:hypothetical protein
MASSLACSNWRHIGARNPQQRNLRPPRHPLAAELFSCLGRAQRVKFLDEGLAILLVHPLNVLEDGEKAFGGAAGHDLDLRPAPRSLGGTRHRRPWSFFFPLLVNSTRLRSLMSRHSIGACMIPLIRENWLIDRNLVTAMGNSMPPRDPKDDDDEDEDEEDDDEADEPAVIREPDEDE